MKVEGRNGNGGMRSLRRLIKPDEKWDLGHVDDGRPGEYAGPEHRRCNRAAPPIAAWAALAAAKGDAPPANLPAGRKVERWSRHWYGGFDERCPACREGGRPCEEAEAEGTAVVAGVVNVSTRGDKR